MSMLIFKGVLLESSPADLSRGLVSRNVIGSRVFVRFCGVAIGSSCLDIGDCYISGIHFDHFGLSKLPRYEIAL
jgi:hypothetical protein